MKKAQFALAYNILSNASLVKCEVDERILVVKALRTMRHEAEETTSMAQELESKCRDILLANDADSSKRAHELKKAQEAEAKKPATTKTVGLLKKDLVRKVIESNPAWSGGAIMLIEDTFINSSKE